MGWQNVSINMYYIYRHSKQALTTFGSLRQIYSNTLNEVEKRQFIKFTYLGNENLSTEKSLTRLHILEQISNILIQAQKRI